MEGMLGQLVELMTKNLERQNRSIELQEETNQKLTELLQEKQENNDVEEVTEHEMGVIRVTVI